MPFDLKSVLASRAGEGASLWHEYLNPQQARVLRSIGFDRDWRRGEGSYLWDSSGDRYLDLLTGFGVFALGRGHPVVRQALHDLLDLSLADLIQMDTPLLAGLLGEQLIERTPGLDRAYFGNSGTEMVETALKFARRHTGRGRVLYCDHGFHGLTTGSLSVNGGAEFRSGFGPLLPDTKIPFGDLDALRREVLRGDVAALLIEPIQGKGVHVAPPAFLVEAADLLHRHGALLVCDEVQVGMGRTGSFWSYQHDLSGDVLPDIVTVSKALSGGYVPVGATIARSEIFDSVYSSMDRVLVHDTTFGANDQAMTAGLATLSVIDDERLVENAAAVGGWLLGQLRELVDRYELVADVRGRGLMIGIEFGRPHSRRLRAQYRALSLARHGLFTQMVVCALFERHHIVTQTAADHADVLKLLPPLNLSRDDAESFLDAFCSVMDSIHDSSRSVWHFGWSLTTRTLRNSPAAGAASQPGA